MLTLSTDKKTYRFCKCGLRLTLVLDNARVLDLICPKWIGRDGGGHDIYRKEKSNTGRFCKCGKKMITGIVNEVLYMVCPRWLESEVKHDLYREPRGGHNDQPQLSIGTKERR